MPRFNLSYAGHYYTCIDKIFISRFNRNSETNASELLENLIYIQSTGSCKRVMNNYMDDIVTNQS